MEILKMMTAKKKLFMFGGCALIGFFLFCAGFFTHALFVPAPTEEASAPQIRLRVYDGCVEWNDGTFWHSGKTVNELCAQDPLGVSEPAAEEASGSSITRQMGAVVTPKAPKPAAPAADSAGTAVAPPSGGGGGETPVAPPAENPPPAAGDGENVEWSPDIL